MFMALSSIWMLLLLFGTAAFLVPSLYTLSLAFGDAFGARYLLYGAKSLDAMTGVNDLALVGLGYLVGYPIASASGKESILSAVTWSLSFTISCDTYVLISTPGVNHLIESFSLDSWCTARLIVK